MWSGWLVSIGYYYWQRNARTFRSTHHVISRIWCARFGTRVMWQFLFFRALAEYLMPYPPCCCPRCWLRVRVRGRTFLCIHYFVVASCEAASKPGRIVMVIGTHVCNYFIARKWDLIEWCELFALDWNYWAFVEVSSMNYRIKICI